MKSNKVTDGKIMSEYTIRGVKYKYNIVTYIPDNLEGYEQVILSDDLDNRLKIISTAVLVNDNESDFKATVDGQVVTLTLSRDQLPTIVGEKVVLQITAQIKADAAMEIIENQATIQLNDNPAVDSNIVTGYAN